MQRLKELVKKTRTYKNYLRRKYDRDRLEEMQMNHKVRGPIMEKYLPKNSIGAELGVLKGAFSPVLLDRLKPKELHLIDPWFFLDADWPWAGGNTSTVDAVRTILHEQKEAINNKQVFVHIQDDLIVLEQFPDQYFDWVYLDSSHAYDHTVDELEIIKRKIKPDGIICGDDWRPDPSHRHHGVFKAVNEFMAKEGYELIYADEENLQWFIKKK